MKLVDLAGIIKKSPTTLAKLCADGKFKTATKIKEDHRMCWYVSDEEAEEFIKNFKDNRFKAK